MKKLTLNVDLTSTVLGALVGALVMVVAYEAWFIPNQKISDNQTITTSENESTKEEDDEADKTVTAYETQIKQFEIKTSSGEKVHCTTPENFYSLTDQYMENLASYYDMDTIKSDSMVVVGDSTVPYSSKTIINANCLSDVKTILEQLHSDDESYDPESVLDSEAYTYMKTGKIPDDAPDNYEIKEVDSFKQGKVEFKVFLVEYDNTYENEAEDEEDAEPVVVHTKQLAAYSDTEDAVEVVLMQEEFNKEEGLKLLREFLNAK